MFKTVARAGAVAAMVLALLLPLLTAVAGVGFPYAACTRLASLLLAEVAPLAAAATAPLVVAISGDAEWVPAVKPARATAAVSAAMIGLLAMVD